MFEGFEAELREGRTEFAFVRMLRDRGGWWWWVLFDCDGVADVGASDVVV